MPRFTYGDIVQVKATADQSCRPGAKAWVIAVIEDRKRFPLRQLPPGTVYSIEFEGGEAIDIIEDDVETGI